MHVLQSGKKLYNQQISIVRHMFLVVHSVHYSHAIFESKLLSAMAKACRAHIGKL